MNEQLRRELMFYPLWKKKKKNLMGVGILPLPMYLRDLNLNQNEQACEKVVSSQ